MLLICLLRNKINKIPKKREIIRQYKYDLISKTKLKWNEYKIFKNAKKDIIKA